MRSLALLAIAVLLTGCASLGLTPVQPPTLAGLVKYTPPTADKLGPACEVPSPNADDSNACDLFKINVYVCGLNVAAVGGKVNGVLVMVPQYGAIAAGMNALAIEPVINATQLWFCNANGYVKPVS